MTSRALKTAEKVVVEQELRLTKSDLIEIAYHLREREFEEEMKLETSAIVTSKDAIFQDAIAMLKLKFKPLKLSADIRRGKWGDEIHVSFEMVGLKFDEKFEAKELGAEFAKRWTNLEVRIAKNRERAKQLELIKKSRSRFKNEYLSQLLEATPEGRKILENLKALTLKVGERPAMQLVSARQERS